MKYWKFSAVLMALSILNATSSQAGELVTGRWAANPSSCEGFAGLGAQSPLVVTNYAVRWQGDSCRIGRMYKTGETIYIQAFCWGETGEKSIPVSLHPHAGRLSVTWDHGTRGDLQRCP
jgi:hypothetical protein